MGFVTIQDKYHIETSNLSLLIWDKENLTLTFNLDSSQDGKVFQDQVKFDSIESLNKEFVRLTLLICKE